jgi:hypothetical protein
MSCSEAWLALRDAPLLAPESFLRAFACLYLCWGSFSSQQKSSPRRGRDPRGARRSLAGSPEPKRGREHRNLLPHVPGNGAFAANARKLAAHASWRTTSMYVRIDEEMKQEEVERLRI